MTYALSVGSSRSILSPGWYGGTVGQMRGLLFGRHNPCYLIDGQQGRVYRKYEGCSFQLGFQVKAL
jgi:hypothetical protein